MRPRWDAPECAHGTPGGTPATCALCRVTTTTIPRDRHRAARVQPHNLRDWREQQLPIGDRD